MPALCRIVTLDEILEYGAQSWKNGRPVGLYIETKASLALFHSASFQTNCHSGLHLQLSRWNYVANFDLHCVGLAVCALVAVKRKITSDWMCRE